MFLLFVKEAYLYRNEGPTFEDNIYDNIYKKELQRVLEQRHKSKIMCHLFKEYLYNKKIHNSAEKFKNK